jgi:hypothetical protein
MNPILELFLEPLIDPIRERPIVRVTGGGESSHPDDGLMRGRCVQLFLGELAPEVMSLYPIDPGEASSLPSLLNEHRGREAVWHPEFAVFDS